MEPLNIARININAPYKVWNEDLSYRFETDNGISYVVDFDTDDNPYFRCYWFNLTNPRHAKSPGDLKEIIARFDSEIAMFNDFKPQ